MSIFYVVILSVVSFAVLFVLSKLIGNRQMSEMNMFDYINGITIGSIAAEMATDIEHFEKPLAAMIAYGILVWLLSVWTGKSVKLRRFLSGKAVILMNNGKIYKENLKTAKLDVNDLLTQLRVNGYFNPDDVKTAVLESNGKISVLPKASARSATNSDLQINADEESICVNVILDGCVMRENLKKLGLDENWLKSRLAELKIGSALDVFLAFVDPNGNLCAYKHDDTSDVNDVFQ